MGVPTMVVIDAMYELNEALRALGCIERGDLPEVGEAADHISRAQNLLAFGDTGHKGSTYAQ